MDDEFLKNYQQAPRPEFARQLQDKLNGGTNMLTTNNVAKQKTWRHNVMRWSPALIAATLVLALALVIALPPKFGTTNFSKIISKPRVPNLRANCKTN